MGRSCLASDRLRARPLSCLFTTSCPVTTLCPFPLGVLLLPGPCCSVILTRPFVYTHLLALAIRHNQLLLYSSHSLPILPSRRGLAHRHILKHAAELAYRIVPSIDQFRQSGTSGTALPSLYSCKRRFCRLEGSLLSLHASERFSFPSFF
jgi:hypothetical protein